MASEDQSLNDTLNKLREIAKPLLSSVLRENNVLGANLMAVVGASQSGSSEELLIILKEFSRVERDRLLREKNKDNN